MKKILLLLLGVIIFSCSNNETVENTLKDTSNPFLKNREAISQLAFDKYHGNITDGSFQISLNGILGVNSDYRPINLPKTRSAAVIELDSISSKEGKELFYAIINTEPTDFDSPEEYTQGLMNLLNSSKVQRNSTEYYVFESAIQYSSDLLINKLKSLETSVPTRSWRSYATRQWKAWGKCACGIVGGGIIGGLGGAAAGSAVPGLGTTAGTVWGAIGGALSGAAASC